MGLYRIATIVVGLSPNARAAGVTGLRRTKRSSRSCRPIDECEDLARSTRTAEFAERVRARIEAKARKIADLEKRNEELEMKLAHAASSS